MGILVQFRAAPELVEQATWEWPEYAKAIELLARREHSRFELEQKLRDRKFNERRITSVVAALIERGTLSDRRFTEEYVHFRTEKGDGPLKIRRNLVAKGVDAELIGTVMSNDEVYWIECARRVLEKRFKQPKVKQTKRLSKARDSRKKIAYLQSKGYRSSTVRKVVFDDR